MFTYDKEPKKENKLEKIEFTKEEKKIIKVASEKGIGDKEFLNLINHWTDVWQKRVEKEKGNEFNIAQIKFLRRRMYLYINIGLVEEAREDFEDATELAYQTKNEELIRLMLIDFSLYMERN